MGAYLYILRCADGSYYVGTTVGSLELRLANTKQAPMTAIQRVGGTWHSCSLSISSDWTMPPPSAKSRAGDGRRKKR